MSSEAFPEAFRRFEEVVDVDSIKSFRELRIAFSEWAGYKWLDTRAQRNALAVEARRLGIPAYIYPFFRPTWRHEVVIVRNRGQHRFRDLKSGRFIRKP